MLHLFREFSESRIHRFLLVITARAAALSMLVSRLRGNDTECVEGISHPPVVIPGPPGTISPPLEPMSGSLLVAGMTIEVGDGSRTPAYHHTMKVHEQPARFHGQIAVIRGS